MQLLLDRRSLQTVQKRRCRETTVRAWATDDRPYLLDAKHQDNFVDLAQRLLARINCPSQRIHAPSSGYQARRTIFCICVTHQNEQLESRLLQLRLEVP
jgi:hypothetical protein